MVGIGTFMEGIDQNYIIYDAFYEMGWRKEIDLDEWSYRFADRRYGYNKDMRKVWKLFKDSVYSPNDGSASNVVAYHPNFNSRVQAAFLDIFGESLQLSLKAVHDMRKWTPTFRHDFVDLAREFIADMIAEVNALFRGSIDRCMIIGKDWAVKKGYDIPGWDIKRVGECGMGHSEPCDKDVLMKECEATPDCVAFNMNGFLKSNSDGFSPAGKWIHEWKFFAGVVVNGDNE